LKKFIYIILFIVGFGFSGSAQNRVLVSAEASVKFMKYYPNPAVSDINFEFQKGYNKSLTFQVYNFIGKKEGVWRRYSLNGDIIAIENYRQGGKDGVQRYFTNFGDLLREESWKAYNPDAPYDTIPVYGTGSNEIISYKIVRAEQYSVKHGEWKYYDPSTGLIARTEVFDRGHPQNKPDKTETVADDKSKPKVKPQEVLDYEKKNSGRKKVKVREGQTGL